MYIKTKQNLTLKSEVRIVERKEEERKKGRSSNWQWFKGCFWIAARFVFPDLPRSQSFVIIL